MPRLQTYEGVYLWDYVPSLWLGVVFAMLFFIATLFHSYKMVKTKLWFCAPFVCGGLFEVIGYIGRATSTYATGNLAPYLIQAIFLVLPPVLFAATLYMVYSRIVRAVQGEAFSLLSPRWTTITFVTGDFVCLNIQGNGAPLLSQTDTVQIGKYMVVAGLILQILMFLAFMLCCVSFDLRFRDYMSLRSYSTEANYPAAGVPWKSGLMILYGTSILILVRNLYRVVDFVMGAGGYLSSVEWPFYVLDGAPMLVVMGVFYVWYPSDIQPRPRDPYSGESFVELMGDGEHSGHYSRHSKVALDVATVLFPLLILVRIPKRK